MMTLTQYNERTAFLNNDYLCNVEMTIRGKKYLFRSAEAAYYACRYENATEEIAALTNQNLDAASYYRAVLAIKNKYKDSEVADWRQNRDGYLRNALGAKFSNPELAEQLLNLGEEADDGIEYSVGWTDPDLAKYYMKNGVQQSDGYNRLGKALYSTRNALLARRQSVALPRDYSTILASGQDLQLKENDTIGGITVGQYRAENYYDKTIHAINEEIKLADGNNKKIIRTSYARQLHQKYISALNGDYSEDNIVKSLKTALGETRGESTLANIDTLIPTFRAEFNAQMMIGTPCTEEMFEKIDVPLSPFMEKNMYNQAFLNNGGRTLYASTKGLDEKDNNLPLYYIDKDGEKMFAGKYESTYDKLGLTRISMYCGNGDESIRKNEMNRIVNSMSDYAGRITPAMQDKAVNILKSLRAQGYSYTLEPEEKGQIAANINELKITVRIVDVSDAQYKRNENGTLDFSQYDWSMIGRIYDKGNAVTTYNSTASRMAGGMPNIPYVELNPLRYALGKNLLDENGNEIPTQVLANKPENAVSQNFYSSGKKHTVEYGYVDGRKLTLHSEKKTSVMLKEDTEYKSPEEHLRDAVKSSRENFMTEMKLDQLFEEFKEHGTEDIPTKCLSSNEKVANIQEVYWHTLHNPEVRLVKPSRMKEHLEDLEVGNPVDENGVSLDETMFMLEQLGMDITDKSLYGKSLTPEQMIKAHLQEYVDVNIGQFDKNENGKRFDPAMVIEFMNTEGMSRYTRNDKVSEWIGQCGIDGDEFLGADDYFHQSIIDRSVQFNENTAVPLEVKAESSKLTKQVNETLQKNLTAGGLVNVKAEIDSNGIVRYEGYRVVKQTLNAGNNPYGSIADAINGFNSNTYENGAGVQKVVGLIGPICDYDQEALKDGMHVVTELRGGKPYRSFVPHMTAYVLEKEPGDTSNFKERTRFRTYENQLMSFIAKQVNSDLADSAVGTRVKEINVGKAYSCTSFYSNLYKFLLPSLDFKDYYMNFAGKSEEEVKMLIVSAETRYKYDSHYVDGASLQAEYNYNKNLETMDEMNDNFVSDLHDCDDQALQGYRRTEQGYDDITHQGNAKLSGIVHNIAYGSYIDEDGRQWPARNRFGDIDKLASSPLAQAEINKYTRWDSADRQAMVYNNETAELYYTQDTVGFTQFTLGGWTQDDGIVISKALSDKLMVPDAEHPGQMRHLKIGDKLCDSHGNKGVITHIIDPNMDERIAEKKGILEVVKLFKENPHLDATFSPYAPVSRSTGGTYVECNDNNPETLYYNSKEYQNSLGHIRLHVLSQTVDEKTHIDNALRKFSAQGGWGLLEGDGQPIIKEMMNANGRSWDELRDYMNVIGADIDENGMIFKGYRSQPGENKKVFTQVKVDDWRHVDSDPAGRMSTDIMKQKKKFENEIEGTGGLMALSFNLIPVTANYKNITGNVDKNFRFSLTAKNEKGEIIQVEGLRKTANGNYLLPVMSSKIRAATELYDDEVFAHEYTNHYKEIYGKNLEYNCWMKAAKTGDMRYVDLTANALNWAAQRDASLKGVGSKLSERLDSLTQEQKVKICVYNAKRCALEAQRTYERLQNAVLARPLNTSYKYNFLKEGIMSKRQKNSATAVLTADPTLNTDECKISKKTARALGLVVKDGKLENDHLMAFRDPVLRKGAFRYFKVNIDNSITGIALSPHAVSCMDGDFDGDTLGLLGFKTPEARKCAELNFMPHANMLDVSANGKTVKFVKPGTDELASESNPEFKVYPLFFKTGLDIAAGCAAKPELKAKYEELEYKANYYEEVWRRQDACKQANPNYTGATPPEMRDARRKEIMSELDEYWHEAYKASIGQHCINYGNTEEHIESLVQTVKDGSKGKLKDVESYAKNSLNIDVKLNEDGSIAECEKIDNLYKEGRGPGWTLDLHSNQQIAAATKSFFAGNVGAQSQRLMGAIGTLHPLAALELSQPLTQSVMQCKKSASEARTKIHNICEPLRQLYAGKDIMKVDSNGNEIPLSQACETEGKWIARTVKTTREDGLVEYQSVPMTPDRFKNTYNVFMKDKDGMNIEVNAELVDTLTDEMFGWTDANGRVHDKQVPSLKALTLNCVTNAESQETTPEIYRLVYGKLPIVTAIKGLNPGEKIDLFGHPKHECMLPQVIRDNRLATKEGRIEDIVPLVADDCASTYRKKLDESLFVRQQAPKPTLSAENGFKM